MNISADSAEIVWMRRAIELARSARDLGEIPVGAVVVQGGDVIAEGHNRTIADSDPTAHAEIVALRSAAAIMGNHRMPDASLYVTLEPCAMCAGAIVQARLESVVFGASDPKSGAAGSVFDILRHDALNHQSGVVGGVLQEECADLLRWFFESRRDSAGSAT